MTGVLFWLARWACLAGTRDFCSALAALVGLVQNIFCTSPYTISVPLFVPIDQQAGHAVVLGRLSLSVCLWMYRGHVGKVTAGFHR
jgi:hypothetical protein